MVIIKTHLFTQITTFGFSERIAACVCSVYGIATVIGWLADISFSGMAAIVSWKIKQA